jgi:hypothetical protein
VSISISVNGAQVVRAFDVTSRAAFNAVKGAVEESAVEVRDLWRDNATQSSGKHGKHYPKSINYKMVPSLSAIVAEVEPTEGMMQAGMSFEFGSRNQPPHLDGQRAKDSAEPKIEQRIDRALGRAL